MADSTRKQRLDDLEVRHAALTDVRQSLAAGSMTFGQALRRLRKQLAKLNQDDFAQACKVSLRTIRQLEQNEGNPTVETLNSVFGPFGMQVGIVERKRRAGCG